MEWVFPNPAGNSFSIPKRHIRLLSALQFSMLFLLIDRNILFN